MRDVRFNIFILSISRNEILKNMKTRITNTFKN